MSLLVGGMIAAGLVTLLAGLILVRGRVAAAGAEDKLVALGPVFEATALAIFAAEHFLDAADLAPIVPHWLPGPLFWTYFVGVALLAAAISLVAWRSVRWSAALLALLFLIIVATVDLPGLPQGLHDRFFWILTVRETAFASGAIVLAASLWPRAHALAAAARTVLAATLVFYGIHHFLHPRNVPGVPLEKITPAWIPAPMLLACVTGATLVAAGIGLLHPRTRRFAAAGAGLILLALTVFFYIPILATEIHTAAALEGMNYVGDTLLFAATILLAGFQNKPIDNP